MKKQLREIYENIRAEKRAEQRARRVDAYGRAPELAALDAELAELLRQAGATAQKPLSAAEKLSDIGRRRSEALAKLGLPADYLTLQYACPVCRDSGYVDADGRSKCACQLQYAALLCKDTLINDRETFSAFDEAIFTDDTQRKRTLNAKRICEGYAGALPQPEKPNLLLMGPTGVGKSFLSNAIAFSALTRGIDAHRLTAYQFAQDMLSDIRTGSGNATRCRKAVLLVLDDLGTEPVIPNVSNEWLFTIVNERILGQLPTVIATNLDFDNLLARYGERLLSRLTDRSMTNILILSGKDLRVNRC